MASDCFKVGAVNFQVRLDGQTVWLIQKPLAELFDVSAKTKK